MKKIPLTLLLLATTLSLTVSGMTNAGTLNATIVEENNGSTGQVTWTILNEKGFLPVSTGKGQRIRVNLQPGRYIVSIDGDTQGRESIEIANGDKSIQITTRKFY